MIEVNHLSKQFGADTAVDDISFAIPQGAFLVLLGPSGCGKSTILRMLAGLETPSGGTIRFDDLLVADAPRLSLPPQARGAGLVFQSYALWPHMSVAGNVEWPLKIAGLAKQERRSRVAEALETMGIETLAARYPGEISGGQQQRVALARMMAPRPRYMLFDEPLSNLDATLRVEMRHELTRIHKLTGATAVYVTHDQAEAMSMASHVAVLDKGRIEQFAAPRELLANPASAFVARFVGTPPANLVPIESGAWLGEVQDPALAGATGSAMVRAEDLDIALLPGPRHLAAERLEVIPMAGRQLVTGRVGQHRLTAIVAGDMPVPEHFFFVLPARATSLFDTKGHPRS